MVVTMCGCDKQEPTGPVSQTDSALVSEQDSKDYRQQLKELYEKAKGAGEQVPDDVDRWYPTIATG